MKHDPAQPDNNYNVAPPTLLRRIADARWNIGVTAAMFPSVVMMWVVTWLLADYATFYPALIAGGCAAVFTIITIAEIIRVWIQ